MEKKVLVVGGGINGMVAAYYLRKAGKDVSLLERKQRLGGACASEMFQDGAREIAFPSGASVFGMMQDFIFRETGLSDRISMYHPVEPSRVYFGEETRGTKIHDDLKLAKNELHAKWGEKGNLEAYRQDLDRVSGFLVEGFRKALTPSLQRAKEALGESFFRKWFQGSARELLEFYFTSDRQKIFKAMAVTESGPVSLDDPGSAFNLALMSTGTVLGGGWGFVNGGIWKIIEELEKILLREAVEIKRGTAVAAIDPAEAEAIFLATDPLSAATLLRDGNLMQKARSKKMRGSSGKCVLFFNHPVVWKDENDGGSAFRFFYEVDTLEAFHASTLSILDSHTDFSPSSFQVYCEGWAMRQIGWNENHDYLSVFFKDLAWDKPAADLVSVQRYVEEFLLSRIENRFDFIGSRLFSPKDLERNFFFPEGNIDHIEVCQEQNYFARTFSNAPETQFYQFGSHENVYYCGAGSYPCGSVAGTAGYLAATQYLNR